MEFKEGGDFFKDPYAGKVPTPNQDAEREREQIAQLQLAKEQARDRMRSEGAPLVMPVMTPADAAAAGVPFTIEVPDAEFARQRVCVREGTRAKIGHAFPAEEISKGDYGFGLGDAFISRVREYDAALIDLLQSPTPDDSLDAMASGIRHTEDEIRRGPSPSVTGGARVPYRRLVVDADDTQQQKVLQRVTAEINRAVDDAARDHFSGAIVYLFGAISKDPDYKRRFMAAQRYCERWGMLVLNPVRQPVCPAGRLSYDFYMQHCFADIRAAELLIPVPSPYLDSSNGSATERAYAVCLGKPILDGFIPEEV